MEGPVLAATVSVDRSDAVDEAASSASGKHHGRGTVWVIPNAT